MEKVFSKEVWALLTDRVFLEKVVAHSTLGHSSWVLECDGLTEAEIGKLGYATLDAWLVEPYLFKRSSMDYASYIKFAKSLL